MAPSYSVAGILLPAGTHAARPAANAVPQGALYSESDTSLIYQSDGSTTWTLWATLTASSILTTKGDLAGYDTAPNRIPVGSDGYVLTADSAQALGLKWAAAATTTPEAPRNWIMEVQGPYGTTPADYYNGSWGAASATDPQDAVWDLGQPRSVSRVHVKYGASNYSTAGSLQYWDGAAWQTVATWGPGLATLDRVHTFAAVTAQLWRFYTTAGGGINFASMQMFDQGGTDFAYGITPTSNVSYASIGNITNGNTTNSGDAAVATNPQNVTIDLGAAQTVKRATLLFRQNSVTSNTTIAGSIDSSPDNVTWTSRVSFVHQSPYVTHKSFDFGAGFSDRYWRLNTTSGGGINLFAFELIG